MINGDLGATFAGTAYTPVTGPNDRKYAVRVRLQEDRILNVQKKFFCERTTEKTITLTVMPQILLGFSGL
jgi:hypothetical protein